MDRFIYNKLKNVLKKQNANCTFNYRNETLRIQVASNRLTENSAYIICQEFQFEYGYILDAYCETIDEIICSRGSMGWFAYIICR